MVRGQYPVGPAGSGSANARAARARTMRDFMMSLTERAKGTAILTKVETEIQCLNAMRTIRHGIVARQAY